jgi:hypothetical protein
VTKVQDLSLLPWFKLVDCSAPNFGRQDGRLANISDFHNGRRVDITMNYSFRHLDPSATKVYRGTVLYGIEDDDICHLLRVKGGYVVETPVTDKWIRGQHIDTLKNYFTTIKPLRIIHDGL